MAKKSKKRLSRKKRKAIKATPGAVLPPATAGANIAIRATTSEGKIAKLRGREFNPDYSHIIRDLKRIGFLSILFISIIVALSFVTN